MKPVLETLIRIMLDLRINISSGISSGTLLSPEKLLTFLLILALAICSTRLQAFWFASNYQISINGKSALDMRREINNGKVVIIIQVANNPEAEVSEPNPGLPVNLQAYHWLYYWLAKTPGLKFILEYKLERTTTFYFSGPAVDGCHECLKNMATHRHYPNEKKRDMDAHRLVLHRGCRDEEKQNPVHKIPIPRFFMFSQPMENWLNDYFSSGESSGVATVELAKPLAPATMGSEGLFHVGHMGGFYETQIMTYDASSRTITQQQPPGMSWRYSTGLVNYHIDEAGVITSITVNFADAGLITYSAVNPSGAANGAGVSVAGLTGGLAVLLSSMNKKYE